MPGILELLKRWLRKAPAPVRFPLESPARPSAPPARGYDRVALIFELKRDEGYDNCVYFDSLGILTTLIGHALGHVPVTPEVRAFLEQPGVMDRPFSDEAGEAQFFSDLAAHEKELRILADLRGVDFDALTDRRQRALINMAFNMGTRRLGGFVLMWAALKLEAYPEAARQALDSEWAPQVGARANRIAAMIHEG